MSAATSGRWASSYTRWRRGAGRSGGIPLMSWALPSCGNARPQFTTRSPGAARGHRQVPEQGSGAALPQCRRSPRGTGNRENLRTHSEVFNRRRPPLAVSGPGRILSYCLRCALAMGGVLVENPEDIGPQAVPGAIQSIAVLPLENLSGDPSQEYFADGMTDALITELSQIKKLRVMSRTTVMQYKHAKKPLQQIAQELHVDAMVEGSVVQENGRVRISAKLVQTNIEGALWAESSIANTPRCWRCRATWRRQLPRNPSATGQLGTIRTGAKPLRRAAGL